VFISPRAGSSAARAGCPVLFAKSRRWMDRDPGRGSLMGQPADASADNRRGGFAPALESGRNTICNGYFRDFGLRSRGNRSVSACRARHQLRFMPAGTESDSQRGERSARPVNVSIPGIPSSSTRAKAKPPVSSQGFDAASREMTRRFSGSAYLRCNPVCLMRAIWSAKTPTGKLSEGRRLVCTMKNCLGLGERWMRPPYISYDEGSMGEDFFSAAGGLKKPALVAHTRHE